MPAAKSRWTACPPPICGENTPRTSIMCPLAVSSFRILLGMRPSIATPEGQLREPGGLERRLDVHLEVHDVGDKLRVRLRLVPAAHDAEGDAYVALLHERRDD